MSNFLKSVRFIRDKLQQVGADFYAIPSTDEYLNEFVPPHLRRLEWVSGFTGSAGMLVIGIEKNAFFTDGRYTTQAKAELPEDVEIYNTGKVKPWQWCKGAKLYLDTRLHTVSEVNRYRDSSVEIVSGENLVDGLWERDFPAPSQVVSYPMNYAGESSWDKRQKLGLSLQEYKCSAAIISAGDSISWLLNLRASDVPCTPIMLSYAVLYADGTLDLYRDGLVLDDSLKGSIGEGVRVHQEAELESLLSSLEAETILLDPQSSAYWLQEQLQSAKVVEGDDPCLLPKALKNVVEQEGTRHAHIIDGVALTKFLYWLDTEGGQQKLTEVALAEKLLSFRKMAKEFRDISFETIAGFNANGAVIHYHPTEESTCVVESPGMFLLDSGGQYYGGTTDVTRTIAIGEVTKEQKRHFTLVLKGHIALSQAEFDVGTTGDQLDVLARQFLRNEGLDYDHGTGHGVGCYLNVHEGPQRISKHPTSVALQPGMIVSNEPGYYSEGQYGIRIESLVLVIEKEGKLVFETLTQAPIDYRLVDWSIMDDNERQWYQGYHQSLYKQLKSFLSEGEAEWLGHFASSTLRA